VPPNLKKTFVQSTMGSVSLVSTTKNPKQNQVFRSISILFDTLILASLARTEEGREGVVEGGGPHLLDQICMELNFGIEKLVGKKYRDSGLHARQ
jgi:hypothetical protein